MSLTSVRINGISSDGCSVSTELDTGTTDVNIQKFVHKPMQILKDFLNPYREVSFAQASSSEIKAGLLTSLPDTSPLLIDCSMFNSITLFCMGVAPGMTWLSDDVTLALVYFMPESTTSSLWCPVGVEYPNPITNQPCPNEISVPVSFLFDESLWVPGKMFHCCVAGVSRCALMVVDSGPATKLRLCYHLST